jgi:hypothetical protein
VNDQQNDPERDQAVNSQKLLDVVERWFLFPSAGDLSYRRRCRLHLEHSRLLSAELQA